MLVLDIGGGSTDIACVDIGWTVKHDDGSVDVSFKMIESMRFNRAGDRLSHIIATAVVTFLREKYGITEPLDFLSESREPSFTLTQKRQAVSLISGSPRTASARSPVRPGRRVAAGGRGRTGVGRVLRGRCSRARRRCQRRRAGASSAQGPFLHVSEATLRGWLTQDTQTLSLETNGEPGFQDIFVYLAELRRSLAAKGREPHVVILSGRTTRLGFLEELTAKSLRLPLHRVRTLSEILPPSLRRNGHMNLDKLAVVFGAQRFRFGDHIRFSALPEEAIFNRYIGTVRESRSGLRLNKVLIQPGDSTPRSITVRVEPARDVRIGHAFRESGSAQVIANLSNRSHTEAFEVELDVLDDYSVRMQPARARGAQRVGTRWQRHHRRQLQRHRANRPRAPGAARRRRGEQPARVVAEGVTPATTLARSHRTSRRRCRK